MKLDILNFFRFITAVIIIVFHFGQKATLLDSASPFVRSGPQVVPFFFVLSGFILTAVYYPKTELNRIKFYISRIVRIAPLYLLALFFMLCLEYWEGNRDLCIPFLLSATFLQSWIPQYALRLNSPAWAISVLMFCYLTFPFVLCCIKKSRFRPSVCALSTIVLFFTIQALLMSMLIASFEKDCEQIYDALIYYFPLSHYSSFLLGVSGGYLFIRVRDCDVSVRLGWLLFSLSCVVLYAVLQHPYMLPIFHGIEPSAYTPLFLPLVYFLFIVGLALINYGTNNGSEKSFHWCDKAGKISYAMYILQYPLYKIFLMIFPALTMDHPNTGFFLFLSILTGLAIVAYHCIELPFKARLNITFR